MFIVESTELRQYRIDIVQDLLLETHSEIVHHY